MSADESQVASTRGKFILAIDGVGAKHGGGATVLKDTISAALRSPVVGHTAVFCSPKEARRFDLEGSARLEVIDCSRWVESWPGRSWWLTGGFESAAMKLHADAVLGLNGGGLARRAGVRRRIVLVQQALPFWGGAREWLNNTTRFRLQVIKKATGWGCRRASRVVVQSETMREAVTAAFGLPADRTIVLRPCPGVVAKETESAKRARRYEGRGARRMLYVGSGQAFKNTAAIGRALERLSCAGMDVECVATLEASHPLGRVRNVKAIGYCDEERLADEYALADVLVMPSLVETVGLSLVEAMGMGVPVIVADRPYAHEACQSAAIYFDPLDEEDLARKLEDVLANATELARLSREGLARARELCAGEPYDRLIACCFDN